MDNPQDKLANLSAQDKRQLLEKILNKKEQKSRNSTETGFILPPEYAALKRQFEGRGDQGIADLFYQSFDGVNGAQAIAAGATFTNFCSYNYLGMSGDPLVSQAAITAIDTYGTSVSASRLVSGERPLHRELETALAKWVGVEDAIVFVGGFATNEDTIGHLMEPDDLILYDSLIHASVQQGARLSGATVLPFPHGNLDALENILQRRRNDYRQALIVVEGIYSMDGDIPDLPHLVEIKKRHNALLMVDEAHSIGVLGATGKGISEHYKVPPKSVDLWMGTLSKSFASCGGYLAGDGDLITYLRHTAPGFVYSVGLSPPLAAAALASLKLLEAEPERVKDLQQRTGLFYELAKSEGLDIGSASRHSAVMPIMVGDVNAAAWYARELYRQGILALPIGYPAVPENKARLRFFISSLHTQDQIEQTVSALAQAKIDINHVDL